MKNKYIFNNPLVKSLLELVIGILFIVFPVKIQNFIVLGGGIALLVLGVMSILEYKKISASYLSINGLTMALLGLILILVSGLIVNLIPVVIGIILIARGGLSLYTLRYFTFDKKGNILAFATHILVIILGVVLLLFNGSAIIGKIIGAVIIADAILHIIQYFNVKPKRKVKDDNIIDV